MEDKRKLICVADSVRKKFQHLKDLNKERTEAIEHHFRPITEPLKELVLKTKPYWKYEEPPEDDLYNITEHEERDRPKICRKRKIKMTDSEDVTAPKQSRITSPVQ